MKNHNEVHSATDAPQSLAQQRFGEHAEAYVTSAPHAGGADLDRLLEVAQPQPAWEMLDVATGGGHTALKFASYVAHVVASDITPAMLAAAEKHLIGKGVGNATFELVNAESMPFPDASFDLVTCRIAPHHFDDAERFVREAARVLKAGGMLLVQDHVVPDDVAAACFVEAFEKLRDPSHNQAFSEAGWREMFANAGLTVTHVEQLTKVLDFDDWADRQGVTPYTKACLVSLVEHASPAVIAWMQPQAWGAPGATYTSHHIILRGTKSS